MEKVSNVPRNTGVIQFLILPGSSGSDKFLLHIIIPCRVYSLSVLHASGYGCALKVSLSLPIVRYKAPWQHLLQSHILLVQCLPRPPLIWRSFYDLQPVISVSSIQHISRGWAGRLGQRWVLGESAVMTEHQVLRTGNCSLFLTTIKRSSGITEDSEVSGP